MTKSEIRNTISKYTEQIELYFYLDYADDTQEKAKLIIEACCDNEYITLETIASGNNTELETYSNYNSLKKSYITKYDNWITWFKENYKRTDIIDKRIVCSI